MQADHAPADPLPVQAVGLQVSFQQRLVLTEIRTDLLFSSLGSSTPHLDHPWQGKLLLDGLSLDLTFPL